MSDEPVEITDVNIVEMSWSTDGTISAKATGRLVEKPPKPYCCEEFAEALAKGTVKLTETGWLRTNVNSDGFRIRFCTYCSKFLDGQEREFTDEGYATEPTDLAVLVRQIKAQIEIWEEYEDDLDPKVLFDEISQFSKTIGVLVQDYQVVARPGWYQLKIAHPNKKDVCLVFEIGYRVEV